MIKITTIRLKSEQIGKKGYLKGITKEEPDDFMFEAKLYLKNTYYKKVRRRCKTKDDFIKEIKKDFKNMLK